MSWQRAVTFGALESAATPERLGALLIPAYNPGSLLNAVVDELQEELERASLSGTQIVVVDDGCSDGTFDRPEDWSARGVKLLRHPQNLGKGAALQTGLRWAAQQGISQVVTLDADTQHPAAEGVRLLLDASAPGALVLAVRDLAAAGAPRANQRSNAFSNRVLSLFGGRPLRDTQCGLRRYPVDQTLALGAHHPGYAFEADVVLRAARSGMPIVHVDAAVRYPAEGARITHFDSLRDPAKIVLQVVLTTLAVPHHNPVRRYGRRLLVALVFFAAFWSAWGDLLQ